jgi:hypothetical protein
VAAWHSFTRLYAHWLADARLLAFELIPIDGNIKNRTGFDPFWALVKRCASADLSLPASRCFYQA